ncbi:MAG: phage major tail tube protein [Nautiliaceae bacterium]
MGLPAVSVSYNAFVEGIGFLGKVEDFKEPTVKTQKAETPQGIKQDVRILEPMEAEINLNSINKVAYTAMQKFEKAKFVVKESVVEDGKTIAITHTMVGSFDVEENSTKIKEAKKKNIKIYPIQYTKEIDGEEVIFADLENVIARIDGKDILEDIRNAIM